ncbi:MAG: sulfurtransferase FdhD [Cobetia sp.]|uniref:Sulfur carrier protein FdhD n=1 Tax=Cobetia amphilecti TaxID=1055104 RepID=A0AAP4TWF2_9GAMM|nr:MULTISPECIES: formate dehydrogenase accessory sulfurtransferase FdhD [Cobetia]TCJ27662.1 sulfurtransferase FdhD [Halomonas sp. GDM18]UTV88669.1 formate dehydrogenase accessory sulfurtransferase FdhD [Cobetia litoralis]MBF10248.1 sulfurtransferase FdhD [Cobetia sp.]MBK09194.1 sulfurtransferase FdhD [Cobetia sp.]MBU3008111.1 formate dehydrogenase accessory sulfurtransferase FdhD [Cobetia amphilecti]
MPSARPAISRATLPTTLDIEVMDERGERHQQSIAAERSLTIYLNRREIVTLMTLGAEPEALVAGYLRNQGLLGELEDLEALQVDWEVESASVVTRHLPEDIEQRLGKRTVTTGCGQGTVFGNLLERQSLAALDAGPFSQALLYRLLEALAAHNATYRKAGAVHGCALCRDDEVLAFIEDVGRHNAVDTLAGLSWLAPLSDDASDYQGANIFYTTGRLTSEMVLKVAQAGISVLVSRSGVTQKGVELAERFGVLLIARAKGRHFQAVDPAGRLVLDAIPPLRAGDALKSSRHDASGKPSSADGAAGHDKGAQ